MPPKKKKPAPGYSLSTRLIHGLFRSPHWEYKDHIIPPVSASAAYRLETTARGARGFIAFANPEFNQPQAAPIYIYDRLDEPSRGMLEEKFAAAHGAECSVAYATGMAAIAAALGVLLKAGDKIVAHATLYGCTYSLFKNWFPRLGIAVQLIDFNRPGALEAALDERTQAVYFESPCNPTLTLIDIAAVRNTVDAANKRMKRRYPRRRQIFIVVDNTFASPAGQQPLGLGADLAVESLTKNVGGFGTDMGGIVAGPKLLQPDLLLYRKDFGGVLSPKAAWEPLVHGLPTLALRAARQQRTALVIAKFLEKHPKVARVVYPGLASFPQRALARRQMRDFEGNFAPGILIYFLLKGKGAAARRAGQRLMDALASHALTVTLAVSLGQIRTLVEHPASMTHAVVDAAAQARAGIDPGGIRLSIGLETPADLIRDLHAALARV
jgi:cystathionine beta-lyase/cystathionine gamma-synthase